MKSLPLIFASLLLIPILGNAVECTNTLPSNSVIEPVGMYDSVPTKNNPAQINYQYGIDLWHSGECYFGHLTVAAGTEGDPPYGVFSFHKAAADSKIQFASKLTMGMLYEGAGQPDIASKDLFEFTGTLARNQIAGTFTRIDKLRNGEPIKNKMRLKVVKDSARSLPHSEKGATYQDWKESSDRMLKMSGPKW